MHKLLIVTLALASLAASPAPDAETRAWWGITGRLSGDAMQGRDTGSPGHARAANYVAAQFAAAGVKPLGDNGGWFQQVAIDEIAIASATADAGGRSLRFLHDYTVAPAAGMATRIDAPLTYAGYCGAAALGAVRGRLVVCHATRRDGLPTAAEREAAVKAAGGVGIVGIADPGFAVEPPRWPFAYARTQSLAGTAKPDDGFIRITLNAAALAALIGKGGPDAAALIAAGSAGETLPRFDIPDRLRATFQIATRRLTSSNVVGVLPGTDPALASQAIVLSAHLDGYGYGEPVDGDGLYNGTLDDAAYVALLIREAQRRGAKGFRRPVVFAAFTGEEKGLLGSRWFVAHPTLPLTRIAANINLDQLRPIFPLDLLTVHALDDTSLGDDARAVAAGMGIAVQPDPEPVRNLLRRSDQWPFIQAGIPATAFVFGYRPGTASERIYRRWYVTGYHKPQDDLKQPIDWQAASDFNRFFHALVARVADQPARPAWRTGSSLAPALPPGRVSR